MDQEVHINETPAYLSLSSSILPRSAWCFFYWGQGKSSPRGRCWSPPQVSEELDQMETIRTTVFGT